MKPTWPPVDEPKWTPSVSSGGEGTSSFLHSYFNGTVVKRFEHSGKVVSPPVFFAQLTGSSGCLPAVYTSFPFQQCSLGGAIVLTVQLDWSEIALWNPHSICPGEKLTPWVPGPANSLALNYAEWTLAEKAEVGGGGGVHPGCWLGTPFDSAWGEILTCLPQSRPWMPSLGKAFC